MESFDEHANNLGAYLYAVQEWPAGEIALELGEDAGTALLLLLRAARLLELALLTSWLEDQRVLRWTRAPHGAR